MPRYSRLVVLALAVQGALKLWLVHDHEIVACDYPFDDPWYVIASLEKYWWRAYADGGFDRPPAYPLWIAAAHAFGVPLRVSTELLVIAAAAVLAWSLRGAGLSNVASVLIFTLVAFHPFSFLVNDYAMADALYGPLLVFSLAGMVALLARPGRALVTLGTGIALGVLWHTRHEGPTVLLQVAWFAVVLTALRLLQRTPARAVAREVMARAGAMAVAVVAITLALRTMNYASFGAFADNTLTLPEFRALNAALLRILPADDTCAVPVTNAMLRDAYAASPTLRPLEAYFNTPRGQAWIGGSRQQHAGQHEVAGGLFPWALLAAIQWGGQGQTAAATRAFCRRAADEIDAACESGRLRCTARMAGSLLRLRNCAERLPGSARAVAALLWWSGTEFEPRCPGMAVDAALLDAFDVATNRRGALTGEMLHLAGWAVDLHDPVLHVSFRDAHGRVVAITDQLRARPDLDAAFRADGATVPAPIRAAFDLTVRLPREIARQGHLAFARARGETATVAYDELLRAPLQQRRTTGPGSPVEYAIEERSTRSGDAAHAGRAVTLVLRAYGTVVILLGLAAAAATIGLAARRRALMHPVLCAAAVLLLGLIVLRVALFTVVHTLMWPSVDVRYIYPVAALLPCACLILADRALYAVAARRHQSTGSTAAAPTAKR